MMSGELTLEYFAWVRERIGRSTESLVLTNESLCISDVIGVLRARGGGYADAFSEPEKLRYAVNQNYVSDNYPLKPFDTLAIFPPVTGG
jgi:sulfur-carrier protein